jgi:hypothetical protein
VRPSGPTHVGRSSNSSIWARGRLRKRYRACACASMPSHAPPPAPQPQTQFGEAWHHPPPTTHHPPPTSLTSPALLSCRGSLPLRASGSSVWNQLHRRQGARGGLGAACVQECIRAHGPLSGLQMAA